MNPFFLGIDPGLSEVGFGIIELQNNEPVFVDCGIISTKAGLPFAERLTIIKNDLREIIKSHPFVAVGIEELFFVKNITNGIKVSHARGVIMEEINSQGLPIHEFKPTEVKANISGNGQADKKQIQIMIQRLLNLPKLPQPHDAADGLAIAILTSRVHSH